MFAIVATAYKIDAEITERFFRNHKNRNVFLVTDETEKDFGESFRIIPAPEMDIFSITRCANIGIRAAIKSGASIITKTDIDCVVTVEAERDLCARVRNGYGYAMKYWGVDPATMDYAHATRIPRVMGTCCMTAHDWVSCGLYNDAMHGYGFDDYDITRRANRAGIHVPTIDRPKIYHIDHAEKHNRDTINPLKREENIQISGI